MSTPTQHTPGPWENTPGQDTIWADGGNLKVAQVSDLPWIGKSSQWMQEQANARLISAAPELLAALELAEATIERLTDNHPGGFSSSRGTLDVIRAAIVKAGGEA